jgi:hypothetical protein
MIHEHLKKLNMREKEIRIEKETITRKINACYELLDIEKKEESFFEKVHKIINK